jgi:ATP-dependent RNA helicase DeaD
MINDNKINVISTFQTLGISEEVVKALEENGLKSPFPIQEAAIPVILNGQDFIGQAHTGSGKTAAYALPILTKINSKRYNNSPQALILVPTRELAMQVTAEINKFAKNTRIKTVSIYGGQSIGIQFDRLRRGVQILVATPGRLIDHLKRQSIELENVDHVVLDEADRMLDMGFIEDIETILSHINNDERQTCLFSATMPSEILDLAQKYMKNAKMVRLNEKELSLDTIDQSYLIINEKEKFKHLCNFISNSRTEATNTKQKIIVFAATKQRTQVLADALRKDEYSAIAIHGDLSQRERDNAIFRFRKGLANILVSTDIVSRGIDVPAVGHVINYDIPDDPMVYFHRIGRTARAGASGNAVSLVSHDRIDIFGRILKRTKQTIRKLNEEMGIAVPTTLYRQYTPRPYNRYRSSNDGGPNSYGRYPKRYTSRRTY